MSSGSAYFAIVSRVQNPTSLIAIGKRVKGEFSYKKSYEQDLDRHVDKSETKME